MLTRKNPTPEPYRCAGLKLANKYYETYPNPKRFYSLTQKAKKSKKVLTWFLDLPTRLARPDSVGPQFFLAGSFSKGSIYPESLKKNLKKNLFSSPSYAHHLVHVKALHLRKKKSNGVN